MYAAFFAGTATQITTAEEVLDDHVYIIRRFRLSGFSIEIAVCRCENHGTHGLFKQNGGTYD